jgi:hypothetical protein
MKKLLIVPLLAVVFLAAACNNTPNTYNQKNDQTNNNSGNMEAQMALKEKMRDLWTDHVVWTRAYIVSAVAGSPDQTAAANRLMKNQEEIGAAVANYYGNEAGNKLTTLLKQHISIAVDLVKDAKAKDQTKFNADNEKWKQNANEISDFLASANPNWKQGDLRDMMAKHLSTTADELNARINKNYDADVKAFDAIYDHIITMSDALSDGIIKQFPDKF